MNTKIALTLVLGAIALSAHADKYDTVLSRYEKRPSAEETSPSNNHFHLKHDLFLDQVTSDHHLLKGYGQGWRGSYEYLAPNKPFFSIEGAYSEIDNMDWRGSVPITQTFQAPQRKILNLLPTQKAQLRKSLEEEQDPVIFHLNGEKYYCEDDFADERHKLIHPGAPLIIDSRFIDGGHDGTTADEHFKRRLKKLRNESPQYISFHTKNYYPAKNTFEEAKLHSLGSASKTLADINMKFGSNLAFGKGLSVTPFAGLGYHCVQYIERLAQLDDLVQQDFDKHPELRLTGKNDTFYGSVGAKFKYACNPYFDLGLNAQVNHGLAYDSTGFAPKHDKSMLSLLGFRASLPISVHLGKKPKFSLEIEPYMDQFDVGRKETNTGVRLSSGVSF